MSGDRVTIPHVRALDGLRGVAVAGVLLFHGGHLLGGYLGVDLFFVLSGFLITSLLLAEWKGSGHISLGAFWGRRARRLLPALALVLLGVALYSVVFAEPTELARIRGDALATIGYVANWRAIYAGQSYFELFASPSPLQHTWSLAIEEQFYLLWPLLFLGIARFAKRRTSVAVLAAAVALGVASTSWMVILHDPADLNRVYYGTDTRAYALFAGIAVAAAVALWGHARTPLLRVAIEIGAIISIVTLAVMWSQTDAQSERLYVGGFAVAGAAAALICAAATNPRRGPVAWALSFPPLCWLGLISYGLYLWHWPVDVVVDAERTGLTGWPLFTVQTAIAIAIAYASYQLVELPIRRGTMRLRRPLVLVPAITSAIVLALILTTAGAVTGSAETAFDTGSGAPTSTPIGSPASSRKLVRTAPPGELLLVGDSLARSLAPGLVRGDVPVNLWWGALCRVIHGDLPNHPDYRWACPWETDFPRALDFHRPRRILFLMGVGDMFAVRPTNSDRTLTPGDPAWADAYRVALTDATKLLTSQGARLTLLTVPCAAKIAQTTTKDPGAFDVGRVKAANRVIKSVAASDPEHVDVADLFTRLCPDGEYASTVDGVETRRDGNHLSDEGADLVTHWLLRSRVVRAAPASVQPAPAGVSVAAHATLVSRRRALDGRLGSGVPRVLVLGDSLASTLESGAPDAPGTPFGVSSAAVVGCGVVPGFIRPDLAALFNGGRCKNVLAYWRDGAAVTDPHVVLVLPGAWDLFDRTLHGRRVPFGTPGYRSLLRDRLDKIRAISDRSHATLALSSLPCLRPSSAVPDWIRAVLEQPDRSRLVARELRRYAHEHAATVHYIDLARRVCPGGRFDPTLRRTDGVHFSKRGALATWTWLFDRLLPYASRP